MKEENGNVSCSVCGVSLKKLRDDEKAFNKRMDAMNIGITLGSPLTYMLKCPKCGVFTCTHCALDGAEMKRCPKCMSQYGFDSIVD